MNRLDPLWDVIAERFVDAVWLVDRIVEAVRWPR